MTSFFAAGFNHCLTIFGSHPGAKTGSSSSFTARAVQRAFRHYFFSYLASLLDKKATTYYFISYLAAN